MRKAVFMSRAQRVDNRGMAWAYVGASTHQNDAHVTTMGITRQLMRSLATGYPTVCHSPFDRFSSVAEMFSPLSTAPIISTIK